MLPSRILSPPPSLLLLVLISLLALTIALVNFIFQHLGILNQFAIPLPRIHAPRVLITCETDLGIVQINQFYGQVPNVESNRSQGWDWESEVRVTALW